MRVSRRVACRRFPCADTRQDRCIVPGVDIRPEQLTDGCHEAVGMGIPRRTGCAAGQSVEKAVWPPSAAAAGVLAGRSSRGERGSGAF